MTHIDNVIWDRLKYTVISVTRTLSPSDNEDESWYQYIVGRSNARLVCKSRGTLQEVTAHAQKLAFDLNSRRSLQPHTYGSYSDNSNITHKKQENT